MLLRSSSDYTLADEQSRIKADKNIGSAGKIRRASDFAHDCAHGIVHKFPHD